MSGDETAKLQFYPIDPKSWIGETRASSGEVYPNDVRLVCPACGDRSVFNFGSPQVNRQTLTVMKGSRCAGCNSLVRFLASYPSNTDSGNPKRPMSFVAFTEFSTLHRPMILDAAIPERLRAAIASTTESFNLKNYVAAMNGGRRAMEGVFKLLPNATKKKRSLPDLINDASADPSLSEPLKRLAHGIREGGNLGAHFDEEVEPDEYTARHMLELLEYLVTYFYVLPKRVSDLENALEKMPESQT